MTNCDHCEIALSFSIAYLSVFLKSGYAFLYFILRNHVSSYFESFINMSIKSFPIAIVGDLRLKPNKLLPMHSFISPAIFALY